MWGDVGRIYFCIKQQDLTLRRFDDVWLILSYCQKLLMVEYQAAELYPKVVDELS
jgi:hypothetical protein